MEILPFGRRAAAVLPAVPLLRAAAGQEAIVIAKEI
jgi:hypothetical protein